MKGLNFALPAGITRAIGGAKLKAIKCAPQIWFGVGVVTFGACVYTSVKAGFKFREVLDEYDELKDEMEKDMAGLKEKIEAGEVDPEKFTEEDEKEDRRKFKIKFGLAAIKTWVIPVVFGLVSVFSFGKALGIMNGRYANAVATIASLATENQTLREEMSKEGTAKCTAVMDAVEDAAEDTAESSDGSKISNFGYSPYARIFDETNPNFTKSPEHNRIFLDGKLKYFNYLLVTRGYLFLNEVYDGLGYEKTQSGQIMGWKYYADPKEALKHKSANRVSFMLDTHTDSEATRRFFNGLENAVILDFNVDPTPILDVCGWAVK